MVSRSEQEVAQLEREAQSIPEPGGASFIADMGQEIGNQPAQVESAGWVKMWNTHTKRMGRFNLNAIRAKLREVFPHDYEEPSMRGKPAWTSHPPTEEPWLGSYTCPLHPSRPERAEYDSKGYPRCNKIHIPNAMEAQKHLKSKHASVWRLMQDEVEYNERQSREEDRRLNREILAHLAGVRSGSAEAQPLPPEPHADNPPPTEGVVQQVTNRVRGRFSRQPDNPGDEPSSTAG